MVLFRGQLLRPQSCCLSRCKTKFCRIAGFPCFLCTAKGIQHTARVNAGRAKHMGQPQPAQQRIRGRLRREKAGLPCKAAHRLSYPEMPQQDAARNAGVQAFHPVSHGDAHGAAAGGNGLFRQALALTADDYADTARVAGPGRAQGLALVECRRKAGDVLGPQGGQWRQALAPTSITGTRTAAPMEARRSWGQTRLA